MNQTSTLKFSLHWHAHTFGFHGLWRHSINTMICLLYIFYPL